MTVSASIVVKVEIEQDYAPYSSGDSMYLYINTADYYTDKVTAFVAFYAYAGNGAMMNVGTLTGSSVPAISTVPS